MKTELTALILSQGRTFIVMLAAGILVESMWQVKCFLQRRIRVGGIRKEAEEVRAAKAAGIVLESAFWLASAAVLSGFLYYCAYGKPSLHAAAGFFIGLLLWKKFLYYVILCP